MDSTEEMLVKKMVAGIEVIDKPPKVLVRVPPEEGVVDEAEVLQWLQLRRFEEPALQTRHELPGVWLSP